MGCVFSRLMMWILFRSPKMNGAIFGFQKRVWCPKWTPASSICRIDTPAIKVSLGVEPPRRPSGHSRIFFFEEGAPEHPATRYIDRPERQADRLRVWFK